MSTQFASTEPIALPFGAPTSPAAPASPTAPTTRRSSATRSGKTTTARPSQQRNVAEVRKARSARKAAPRRSATVVGTASTQWRIDEGTKQTGRAGIASARQALASARRHQFENIAELPDAA